jgi:selenobiotic family peptide radical SAM maturase
MPPKEKNLNDIYPACRKVLGEKIWFRVSGVCSHTVEPEKVAQTLSALGDPGVPPYVSDLARLEWAVHTLAEGEKDLPAPVDRIIVNPSVRLTELSWKNLTHLLDPGSCPSCPAPEAGKERALVWRDPVSGKVRVRPATDEDLLVLKMIMEDISPDAVAAQGRLPVGAVDGAVERAIGSGILLSPPSRIRRDPSVFQAKRKSEEVFLSSPSFTLQWHITQACDLHCKHCYDRTDRSLLTLEQAVRVLDDLRSFCRKMHVQGAVSFTGGNPLLHPDFNAIYGAAVDRGFGVAILGNPATKERIREIIDIQMPSFYQVSLEGLREHNDSIRGAGHFDRIMRFLDVLRELNVSSMVMLTLTSENMDQVIPLAEALRGRTDVFHFNRLALFGEGANLTMPPKKPYRSYLERYLEAAEKNPIMGIKDNLINILRYEKGQDFFGGCTGYGCGAAFNFVSLLADGEVHACRKLPSPIGNINTQSLSDIYDSGLAKRYRLGPSVCSGCPVRPACGGCLASAMSHGLNIFKDKDPFCFFNA